MKSTHEAPQTAGQFRFVVTSERPFQALDCYQCIGDPPKGNAPMRTPNATEHRSSYDNEFPSAWSRLTDRRKS
jgi:hypothetical protein